ncbi:carbohydrate ABC transporter permease [Cohnella terricola]|uniref:Sugar ABC transporter permease n=1 Tax=Cohnella terricola TaxID=1289167 RepID=A0A559JWG2_9BACL|nr:sugar ABC transporter permease [Cohnella terricola]TVY04216.1 sugar ABC transporter permease [Cohnella terricola]
MSYKSKPWLSLLAFSAPALLFYAIFLVYPTIGGFYYSLTDWNGLYKDYKFVGISNYIQALTSDPQFIHSLLYTLKYVVVIVILQNAIALCLALLIESRTKSKTLFRTLIFMPNMVSIYISTLMWAFIFSRVAPKLAEYTLLSFLDQGWVSTPNMAFLSTVIVTVWQGAGYLMIIYIAALQGVPKDLKEAATIDGASTFRRFYHIILPLVMPAITICVFLTLNSSFKIFEVVYALTGGGPGYSTEVIALNVYQEGFARDRQFGYATAKAMILFFMIIIITFVQVTVFKKKEVEA